MPDSVTWQEIMFPVVSDGWVWMLLVLPQDTISITDSSGSTRWQLCQETLELIFTFSCSTSHRMIRPWLGNTCASFVANMFQGYCATVLLLPGLYHDLGSYGWSLSLLTDEVLFFISWVPSLQIAVLFHSSWAEASTLKVLCHEVFVALGSTNPQ